MWVVGVEADEIKLAGVRAKLGNIIFTYLCKYIQCKVAGRGCKTRILDRLVELRFCKGRVQKLNQLFSRNFPRRGTPPPPPFAENN